MLAYVLLWLGGTNTWSAWIAIGIAIYGFAVAVHGTSFIVRLYREASGERATA